ncbi:MAG: hypothetical protein J0J14_10075 [Hyphomicrobium sp.]|nr:hypothetical protein [Hyphomicrobium sp.]MBN9264565.1 hypothetical protein [Hyphomicrobium sp.]
MPGEQGGGLRVRRRWRALKAIRVLGVMVAPLAFATLILVIWPVPQTPLQNEDFLLYGISPGVTKVFDRLHEKDPAALVIYYRLFLLYATVGGIAGIGFLARGFRLGLKRGNRSDYGILLFLQSPVFLLFLDDRTMRSGRFGLVILAVLFCIMLPLFWWLSTLMLHSFEAFDTWSRRDRRGE